MDFEDILQKYKLQISIGLVGVILLGAGTLLFLSNQQEKTSVEIITPAKSEGKAVILVDIEGAVEKPGVYELANSARVNDLLVQAGGLSAEADRDWVVQNLNLAQKLIDGAKIYVPTQKEIQQFGGVALSSSGAVAGSSASVASLININTASSSQLDTLWGIGDARAQAIIAGRPYQTIEEVVSKAKVPKNVFERIKNQITVY